MYCPKCGTENTNNAAICIECHHNLQSLQQPGAAAPPPEVVQPLPQMGAQPVGRVPNYLVQSILLTLFCCLPLGIVAIVFAAQVNSKLAAGDYNGAIESSNKAKMWCWWSFGLGLASMVLYIGFMVAGIVSGLAGGY